jgi:hypothetical protein
MALSVLEQNMCMSKNQIVSAHSVGDDYMERANVLATVNTEIGGYFGLDLPDIPFPFGSFAAFQSARAAFRAVLETSAFRTVFVPSYICDSIIKAAEDAGLSVELYDLDEGFLPKGLPQELGENSALIYINYFGLSEANVSLVIERYGAERVLIDQSQALFSLASGAYANIYSPRKFAGLPDGGWVQPNTVVSEPAEQDEGSIDRMRHLILRTAHSARSGYADFNSARLSLSDTRPKRMSRLTLRLMHSIDWGHAARLRIENYLRISDRLGATNARAWTCSENSVPMCYPYTRMDANMTVVRQELADSYDIFSATYWPDVEVRMKVGSIEELMIKHTLFLPVDQRMNREQVEKVCDMVIDLLGRR